MPYQPYQPNWTGQYMAATQQPMWLRRLEVNSKLMIE